LTYILPLTVLLYLHSIFFLAGSVKRFFPQECFGRSGSFKVIDFGTNRKRICDFLLVRHSNLGPILHHFRDIAGFYSTPIFGVPVAPDRSCWSQPERKPYANIPSYVITVRERHRRTVDILWHNRVASRSKNVCHRI